MKIYELVGDVKARGAYSKRRASAVADHCKKLVTAALDATRMVASRATKSITSAAQTLATATLTKNKMPLKARVQKLRSDVVEAISTSRDEIATAAKEGYRSVTDKLVRVADVTKKEQAAENRIEKKARKAKNSAQRLQPA